MQKKTQCSTFKIATCENIQSWKKKMFQESIWKMTNDWHCLPADRSMVCVFWTAQHQQGQESVRNWAVKASPPQGLIMDTKYGKKGYDWSKQALTCYEVLWQQSAVTAEPIVIGSPLYLCQMYFPLWHGNGCHTMLKSRKRRILWAKNNKIWKFGRFSASRSP